MRTGEARIVKKTVIKAYWDCPYCNTKEIDGLKDYCPSCGVHKPKTVKYYKSNTKREVVTNEDLKEAGIGIGHSDGKHPEWICEYCGSLNNYLDNNCSSCGSLKSDSDKDYFNRDKVNKPTDKEVYTYENSAINEEVKTEHNKEVKTEHNEEVKDTLKNKAEWLRGILALLWQYKAVTITAIALMLIIGLFIPYKETTIVNNFSWQRTIYIEEEKTFNESGWTVPVGGRVYYTNEEIYDYEKVVDHYENVEVTKTREVYSHDKIDYIEHENGDGTISEYEIKTPVYVDETYTEIESRPVYKEVPIYKTKFYYYIDRWVTQYTSESSGFDKQPYWNTEYILKNKQRDSSKVELYCIHYDNGDKLNVNLNEWNNTKLGDKVVITKCKLGLVYKQEKVYSNVAF